MVTTTSIVSSFTNRNSIIPLLTPLSVLIGLSEVDGEPPSVVPSACKRTYGVGGGSFTEDFCQLALNGHSAGMADYGDLALIMVDLATANDTATERKIVTLLGGDGTLSDGFQTCRALYDAVVHQYQAECHVDVKDRRFGDRKLCLHKTAQAPMECKRWFQQQKPQ